MISKVNHIIVLIILLLVAVQAPETGAQPSDTVFHQDVSWSPDGTKLLISRLDIDGENYSHYIYSVNADGSDYKKITEGPGDVWASWFRDGSRFVYTSKKNGNDDIYLANADGSRAMALTLDSVSEYHPDWSPDGSRVVFVFKNSIPQICILNGDGTKSVITSDAVQKGNPRWSPNGKKIAYYGNIESGKDSIYIIDANGKNQITLCEGVWPSWSFEGKKILFTLDKTIYETTIGKSEKTKVIDNAFYARWSPDGKKIAFIRQTWKAESGWPATSAVFIASADGSGEYQVTPK